MVNDINKTTIASSMHADIPQTISSSKKNKILLTNISNWYLFEDQILLGFPILRKYENILKSYLIDYTLDKKYFRRPEYLSYDLYETTDLWYMLLFINNMKSVDEFKKETIKVFPADMVTVLNNIINNETELISSTEAPRTIKKSYLKSLNEKSKSLIKSDIDKKVEWFELSTLKVDTANLFNSKYLHSYYNINRGFLKDSNGNLVKAITLNSDGMTSVPSIYYKDGFNRSLNGRIKLFSSKNYSYNSLYNGNSRVILKDIDNNIVKEINSTFIDSNPILIADARGANEDIIKPLNNFDIDGIEFNSITGSYNYSMDGSLPNSIKSLANIENEISFVSIKFDINSIESRNISRLDAFNHALFNVKYSSNISNTESIDNIIYEANVKYKLDSNIYEYNLFESDPNVFNTQNNMSFIKSSIRLDSVKELEYIEIVAKIKINESSIDPFSFEHMLSSITIAGISDTDIINPINVLEDGWYNIEIDYTYNTIDSDGYEIFNDESKEGIYFNPDIKELDVNGNIIENSFVEITDDGDYSNITEKAINNPIRVQIGSQFNNLSNIKLINKDLKLPDKYILTFRISNEMMHEGGGVALLFDYDREKDSGYMIWLSSTKSNPDLTNFEKDGITSYNILQSGFYELDNIYGTSKNIFDNDDKYNIKVNNFLPLEVFNKTIKIVKRYNRIKIYIMNSDGTYDFGNPNIDIEDITNYHINGTIGFLSVFAANKVDIVDYYTWDSTDINSDAEW